MHMREFDEIINYSKGNIFVYDFLCEEIIKSTGNSGIIPFIGSGLTEFAFGENKNFIEDVLITMKDALSADEIRRVKQKEGFIEALDEVISILGEGYGDKIVNKKLEDFYSDEKIDKFVLRNQAISLVPLLNEGDSVTVNFDRVLEYSYELAGVSPAIATPYDCNFLNSKLRSNLETNKALLFKIHGDIISNATERIITKTAFEKNYKNNSAFVENLKKWINKYKLLFIGMDLLKDNYFRELLEETKSEGSNHYAIVGCIKDEGVIEKTKKELNDLNIMPIIYDIDKPISVEIILHKLLVDTKNEKMLRMSNRGEYYFKYSEHDLVGRKGEIDKLKQFLYTESEHDYDFSWWIIYGKDVAGKSKLAYEFARKHAQEWEWYMISPGEIDGYFERQFEIKRRNRKVFIILDDYDCYCGGIDKLLSYIDKLKKFCSSIRMLLIVRDYKNSEIYQVISNKNRNDITIRILVKSAFARPQEVCQLSVSEIKSICYKYIWYRKKSLGLDSVTESEIATIDKELEEFIEDQLSEDQSLILLCSLEKAIRLVVAKIEGETDSDENNIIINKIMRYILTDGDGNYNNPNVNVIEIDRRKDYRKEQAKKLILKYDKQKEFDHDYHSNMYEAYSSKFDIVKE